MNFLKFKTLTRLEQSFFGLPILLTALLFPLFSHPINIQIVIKVGVIVSAFLTARISGMAFNQFIDRHIDAKNPRTANRLLPQGKVNLLHVQILAWGSLLIFFALSFSLNLVVGTLSLLAGCIIVSYSYLKRVHASCHFIFGTLHFLAPLMAWCAMGEKITYPPLFLGMTAFFSITATEIRYAMQDYAFDCEEGLHSIPVKLGLEKSHLLAKGLYALCVLSSFCFGYVSHFHWIYYVAPLSLLLFFFSQKKPALGANVFVSVTLLMGSFLGFLCDLS